MLHALRDRTAANAALLVRICHGIACDASSVAPTQSAWHHSGMRSLQLAARACFEHDSPIASPSGARQTPTSTSPCEAGCQTQPILRFPAASRQAYPSLSGVPFTTASAYRTFRSSAVHSAAAAALPEPTEAAPSSDTAVPEDAVVQTRAPMGIPSAPWTPTDQLQKRKTLPKRMGYMLQELEKERMQEEGLAKKFPDFGPGDALELKLSVPENRRRVAVVKGTCIARRNRGWRTSFTIRNHIGNAGGIERTFPLYSPHIQEITVIAAKKVRRAKLYYLRDRQPREYRI